MTGSGPQTSPKTLLTYRSGERVELGDVVMEPVNGGERMGIVLDILMPNSENAIRSYGAPSGGVLVRWDDEETEVLLGLDVLQGPDYVFFVRRRGESPKAVPTFRSGEPVELGDIVMRPENGETMGVVVKVISPYSTNAIWYGMRSGGALVKWDAWETEVSMGLDVLREEVCLVRRNSE